MKRLDKPKQLLLPANPVFIWGSLLLAMLVNFVPLGRVPWRPDLLMLVLVFWCVHQPARVGMAAAFIFGLCMDVQESALLGQHALAYTVLGYLATAMHSRLLWYGMAQQMLQLLPLFLLAHMIEVAIRMLAGGIAPGWWMLLAPALEVLLWPLATIVLLAPQLRAPVRDATRPL